MKRIGWFLVACLWPALLSAQPAPVVATTVATRTATPTSICVGCPANSTTPAANAGVTAAEIVLKNATPSITTNALYNVGGALTFNGLTLATGSSISGTTGTVPKFTGATALGDSNMTISGSNWTLGGAGTLTGIFIGSCALCTSIPTSAVSSGNFVATVASGTGITSSVTTGNAAATTITLNNTAVTPSTYGSTTAISVFTVDQQGRITSATTATPQLTLSSTYFSSLSAANLTGIPAANLTGTCCGSATNVALLGSVDAFTDATDATSTVTGALHTAGGVGIGKALWVGGLANIAGGLTVQGYTKFGAPTSTTGANAGSPILANNSTILYSSNAAGNGTVAIVYVNASDILQFGSGGNAAHFGGDLFADAGIQVSGGANTISGSLSVNNSMANVGAASGTIADVVCMDSSSTFLKIAAATCVVSSERFKHDIQPFTGDALSVVNRLQPVTYLLNDHENRGRLFGAIAERVDELPLGPDFPSDMSFVNWDDQGRIISLQYEAITMLNTRAIQQLDVRLKALEAGASH